MKSRESENKNRKSVVVILGVGLMGGSLGRALRRSRTSWRVRGVGRRFSRLRLARKLGCVHEYTTDLKAGVRDASVVVLAVPVKNVIPLAKRIRPHLPEKCLLMDVGGVKAPIVRCLEKIFPDRRGPSFVGVHPMTGSEKTGVEHARPDLYHSATCVLTPGRRTSPAAVRRAASFWRGVGARTMVLSPEKHDRWVAITSHLPHLLANALVLSAGNRTGAHRLIRGLAAGSFRDMTRVAEADPVQWSSIFRMNARHLREAVNNFQSVLQNLLKHRFPSADLQRANWLKKIYKDGTNR